MLSFIANLAFLINMFILTINYPKRVQNFFSALFPLVTFDLVPTDDLYDDYFAFGEVEERSMTD